MDNNEFGGYRNPILMQWHYDCIAWYKAQPFRQGTKDWHLAARRQAYRRLLLRRDARSVCRHTDKIKAVLNRVEEHARKEVHDGRAE